MTNTQIVIAELPSDSLTPAHFKQTTADERRDLPRGGERR